MRIDDEVIDVCQALPLIVLVELVGGAQQPGASTRPLLSST